MGRARFAQLLGAAPVLLVCFAARAEEPAAGSAAQWDDRHMRSNFAHFLDRSGPRPAIQGIDRDGRIVHDTTPATRVPELTLTINPLEWQPGGPRASSSPDASASFSSSSAVPGRSGGVRASSSTSEMRHAGSSP